MAPPPLDTQYNSTTKTWSGPDEDHDKTLPLGAYFLRVLKNADPEKIVQIFYETGEETTAREMYLKSVRFGISLKKLGVRSGDIVSIISQNNPLITPLSVGLLCIGAICSYLDEHVVTYYKDEKNDLRRVNPKFIICPASLVDEIMDFIDNQTTIITFGENGGKYKTVDELLINYEREEEFTPVVIKEPAKVAAVILPSSGTTGKPKFICLSHSMLLSQLFRTPKPQTPYEFVTLNICPMYWISGVACAFGDLAGAKTRIITARSSTPELIIEITEKYNATDIFCNATQLTGVMMILRKRKMVLPSLRIFAAGGAAVSHSSIQAMREYVPNGNVISGYGLTEVAGIISIEIFGPESSVGLLAKGIHCRIKGANGELLGPNEVGSIWMRTEYEYLDYFGNEPSRESVIDHDGYLNSLDIGYFDEDGWLYVTGRKADMLEYLHTAVSSTKIESLLSSHPDLVEVCVVGVRVPIYYDIPTAIVVKTPESNLTEEDLQIWLKDKLPDDFHKLRGGIYFVESLPRTLSGKIKKHVIKGVAFDWYHEKGLKIEDFKF